MIRKFLSRIRDFDWRAFRFPSFAFTLPKVNLTTPRVTILRPRLPYLGWSIPFPTLPALARQPMVSAAIAMSIGVSGIGVGIYFATVGTDSGPPRPPQPGIYAEGKAWGDDPPRELPGSVDYTLPARTDTFTVEDADLGKDGVTTVLSVTTPSASDYIYVERLTLDNVICPRLIISTSDISSATVSNNRSDGHAFTLTGGNPYDIQVGTRGSRSQTFDQTYDKVTVRGNGSNAKVKELTFKNIRAFGGSCLLHNLKVGTLTISNSTVGTGDGININDFGFGQTVVVGTFTGDANVETEIDVR